MNDNRIDRHNKYNEDRHTDIPFAVEFRRCAVVLGVVDCDGCEGLKRRRLI